MTQYLDVMPVKVAGEIVDTRLDDLQAELEAAARTISTIERKVAELRSTITEKHIRQTALLGSLIRQIDTLRNSALQQRSTMHELRFEFRHLWNERRRSVR
jgi:predicted  nucleic acid-binding Zn-ribbon protein